MACGMLAEYIEAVKTAINICNNPDLKREILCAPGSAYDKNNGKLINEIVKEKATAILKNLGLAKHLEEKVISLVFLVGMRMLTWAEYIEGTLGISREFSVNFLNSSFFTKRGIIDSTRAAKELMKSQSLDIKQKYKLACLHCFTDQFPALYRQITKEEFYDAERHERIKQPELVKFWSYYLMGEIDTLKGEKCLNQYRLEKAVESGSIAAVEYCLEKTKLRRKKDAIVDAAMHAVNNVEGPFTKKSLVFFQNEIFTKSDESWVPSDYYVDLFCFLLLKMGEDQRIEFLKKDIEDAKHKREPFKDHRPSRVLDYFLNWPYQDNFMKTAGLMWEFLPERDYVFLLLRICDKIESKNENFQYGEERIYDYRGLLMEFWCQSPVRYKRYIFSVQKVTFVSERTKSLGGTKAGVKLLIKLLSLKNFTLEDRKNIRLILDSATSEEKRNILSSEELINVCIEQMKVENWEKLNEIVQNCSLSKEEEDKFKREFSFTEKAKRICFGFMKNNQWNTAESFIKWSSLPEVEINKLKKEMIYSQDGRYKCVDLISSDKKVKVVDQFIRCFFPAEEEVKTFKKYLIFSIEGISKCTDLVTKDQLELVSEFINFCLSSEPDVIELKQNVAYRRGSVVCERLILDSKIEKIIEDQVLALCKREKKQVAFKGGKWEEVEKFLTWCFSSEEEINAFKKNKLLVESGKDIHFNLIKSNQWEEAETFFAWLGLSSEEIKELKKETIFHCDAAKDMFRELMHSEEGDEEFVDYGSKQEAIELLLRWYLTDKETVLKFKDVFDKEYRDTDKENEALLKDIELMIEQRLNDLVEEQRGEKRKSEAFAYGKGIAT